MRVATVLWRSTIARVVAAGAVLLALVLVAAVLFINEPLRRHLEGALNAELEGYSVRLGAVAFQPLGFSITLKDLSISQDAHPQPPVALLPSLQASVHWRALLHGRLLADFVLLHPQVRIDRTQLRQEAASKTALEDVGWQEALQAVYPLKINLLTIDSGELTYIDDDPQRPLQLHQINLIADNIRNVASADHVYPSRIHLDAVVFKSGKLRIDGHANFLAEPSIGIDADVKLDEVQLEYFKPMLQRINLWISNGALWADGHIEYAPQVETFRLKNLTLRGVQLDYVHSAKTAAAEKARVEQVGEVAEQLSRAPVAVVRVDELLITDSTIGYVDKSTDPGYRVFVERADLKIKNVSNQVADGPASALLKGQFMGSGDSTVHVFVGLGMPSPDLDAWVTIEGTQLRSMNALLRHFGNFDVVAGQFTFYSQLSIKKGDISGYLTPVFTDVEVYGEKQDSEKPLLNRIYEGLVGGTQTVLQNRSGEVATTVVISGRASDPETSTWQLAIGLIRNAFVEAVSHTFERKPGADR